MTCHGFNNWMVSEIDKGLIASTLIIIAFPRNCRKQMG